MNEDQLISMVMETKERVDKIEYAIFTKEEKAHLFGTLDSLVWKMNKFEEESIHYISWFQRIDANLSQLNHDVKQLNHDVKQLNHDVGQLKIGFSLLNQDMTKVKTKLQIT